MAEFDPAESCIEPKSNNTKQPKGESQVRSSQSSWHADTDADDGDCNHYDDRADVDPNDDPNDNPDDDPDDDADDHKYDYYD